MLAGYTAAIIGFPSVDQPGMVFATAGARIDEIGLGILCATAVGSVVFPRSVVPVLEARLNACFTAARLWALAVLAGQRGDAEAPNAPPDRRRASSEIHTLISYLAYDTSPQQVATGLYAMLGDRMIYLLPVLSGVTNRISALRSASALTPDLQAPAGPARRLAAVGTGRCAGSGHQLRAELAAATPPAGTGWAAILHTALLARLMEYVDVLAGHRRAAPAGAFRARRPAAAGTGARRRSRRHTPPRPGGWRCCPGVAAALTTGLLCAFWIATEWPDGAIATLMAAIMSSFFATQDDPVPALLRFLGDVVIAGFIAALYLFVVLPQIEGFAVLALVLAPAYWCSARRSPFRRPTSGPCPSP